MSGDYSKRTFDPAKDYGDVLLQQGRVLLDSDWNEAVEMQSRRWRAGTRDLVGRCGTPQETPDGFRIGFDAANVDLTIGIGRLYVDGLLAENHGAPPSVFDPILAEIRGVTPLLYHNQPYYPTVRDDALLNNLLPGVGEAHLVYLDVWQREVNHLQDPEIIEKAVGVDASTRLQTVWQVRILKNVNTAIDCGLLDSQLQGWAELIAPSAGRLTTRVSETPETPDPCLIPPSGGYRGVENRLYRVEIHRRAEDGAWRFKYSRDNGAVAAKVVEILAGGTQVKVDLLGRDKVMTFHTGEWIEILDDRVEFRRAAGVDRPAGEPHEDRPSVGLMRRIAAVHTADQILMLHEPPLPTGVFDPTDPGRHTLVRRWDQGQPGQAVDDEGLLTVAAGPIELEDGIEVEFSLDPADGAYKEGDHWLFAARAVDGSVEELQQSPPHGVHHHYCRLAMVARDANEVVVHDSRRLFPPLNAGPRLAYVGGDGQDADPDGLLPQPLEVAVFHGEAPVVDAKVRFRIIEGVGGRLQSGALVGPAIDVATESSGVASCTWTLEKAPGNPTPPRSQVVEASLLGGDCEPAGQPIRFNGSLSNISLRYVSGDGQEARVSSFVPGRLIVGVEDGIGRPVQGVPVTFSVDQGGGQVRPVAGALGNTVTVNTGPDGLAECEWQLGADPSLVNLVIAKLTDPPQGPFLPVIFRAVIETPAAVGGGKCTVTLGMDGVDDLNVAVSLIPPEGGCICIPSKEFTQTKTVDLTDRDRITFEGCGPASVINFTPQVASPLFLLNEASEIHFHNFTAIGRNPANALIELVNIGRCEVRECLLQSAPVGIRANRSLTRIDDLVIEGCMFQNVGIAVNLSPEGGRIERLLIHRNRISANQGFSISGAIVSSAELSDNVVLAKARAVLLGGDDLQLLRNQLTSSSGGFAVEILVGSENAAIRIADNTIRANAGSGLDYRNDPGQLIFTGNRIEVRLTALSVHTLGLSQNPIAKGHIADNSFTSLGDASVMHSVVQCGPVAQPETTELQHVIFTSNQVRSSRVSTDANPTVYLNSRGLICTSNLVQEPDRSFRSIHTPSGPGGPLARGVMAHNLTTSDVSPVQGFTGNNVTF